MVKNKWTILSRKGKNFENLFVSLLATQITNNRIKRQDPAELIASHWLQGSGNRYLLTEEYEQHKNRLLNFLKEDPKILIISYDVYLDILKRMEESADILPQKDFAALDLTKYLEEWTFLIKRSLQYGYNYYWLSQAISDIVLNALNRNKSQDVFSDFEVLSQAEQLSAISKEKIDILKIVENIYKNNLSLESKEVDQQITEHLKKYAFLGQYYFRGHPWQKEDVLSRIKDLFTSDWKNEQEKFHKFIYNNNRTKNILKKYNFSEYEKQVIFLMKKMSHATNRYDEVHAYYLYKSKKLLDFIREKIGVTYPELIEMNYDEILDYLKNNRKADNNFRTELIEREKDSVLLAAFGKSSIFTGQAAKDLFNKEIGPENIENKKVLMGNCASQGKARGQVVIFESVKDIARVKEGNIMVAKATVPAFVPAMEKAVGIITEMGGLLSHAAIVSREMHLPCIVGVENVTKILKNGQIVEMDANKGIVRLI